MLFKLEAPAIILNNPKFIDNLAMIVRLASCYGIDNIIYSGSRIDLNEFKRIPREFRHKAYADVKLSKSDYPFDLFTSVVPVAIELGSNYESLQCFQHPRNAVYVFGPEDGNIHKGWLKFCHKFVSIPTRHCLNVAMAVGTVLYDRQFKLNPSARLDELLNEENNSQGSY